MVPKCIEYMLNKLFVPYITFVTNYIKILLLDVTVMRIPAIYLVPKTTRGVLNWTIEKCCLCHIRPLLQEMFVYQAAVDEY